MRGAAERSWGEHTDGTRPFHRRGSPGAPQSTDFPVAARRQRRHRLRGDGVAKRDRDANGPLPPGEGALRRARLLQGEPQLGRLGVAPPQIKEAQVLL